MGPTLLSLDPASPSYRETAALAVLVLSSMFGLSSTPWESVRAKRLYRAVPIVFDRLKICCSAGVSQLGCQDAEIRCALIGEDASRNRGHRPRKAERS